MHEVWQWTGALTFALIVLGAAFTYLNTTNRRAPGDLFSLLSKAFGVGLAVAVSCAGFAAAAIID